MGGGGVLKASAAFKTVKQVNDSQWIQIGLEPVDLRARQRDVGWIPLAKRASCGHEEQKCSILCCIPSKWACLWRKMKLHLPAYRDTHFSRCHWRKQTRLLRLPSQPIWAVPPSHGRGCWCPQPAGWTQTQPDPANQSKETLLQYLCPIHLGWSTFINSTKFILLLPGT